MLPNHNNRLSCEMIERMAFEERQMFDGNDLITTQIKSSYPPIFKLGGVLLEAHKMTDNIGKSNCTSFRHDNVNGVNRFYFLAETDYNCASGTAVNTIYWNGEFPEWVKLGFQFIAKKSGKEDIVFTITYNGRDRNGNFRYFTTDNNDVFDNGYVTSAFYNLQNYEVYEAYISGGDCLLGKQMTIDVATPNKGTLSFLSEMLDMIHPKSLQYYVKVRYNCSYNTSMYYATGIVNVMNIPIQGVVAADELKTDYYIGDSDVHLIKGDKNEVDTFKFDITTKEVARKLMLALSSEHLYINDIKYIAKDATLESIEGTNLYMITGSMYISGDASDDHNFSNLNPDNYLDANGDFVREEDTNKNIIKL